MSIKVDQRPSMPLSVCMEGKQYEGYGTCGNYEKPALPNPKGVQQELTSVAEKITSLQAIIDTFKSLTLEQQKKTIQIATDLMKVVVMHERYMKRFSVANETQVVVAKTQEAVQNIYVDLLAKSSS